METLIASRRGNRGATRACPCGTAALLNQPSVAMDPSLVGQTEEAIRMRRLRAASHGQRRGARRHDPGGKSAGRHDFLANACAESATIRRKQYKSRTWRKRSRAALHLLDLLASPANLKGERTLHNLGRNAKLPAAPNHLLLTPDTFVRAPLPG